MVQRRRGAPREVSAAEFVSIPERYKRDLGAYISARILEYC